MSSTADTWLDAYAESHQNPVNKRLHWICVPIIVLSLVGILWAIPVPEAFSQISPALNWGTTFMLASMVYYCIMSIPLALGMVPVVLAITAIVAWMDSLSTPLIVLSAVLFVASWIGQFIGHKIEGKKPSLFEDIQFLMIGPLWILAPIYRKFGVRY